MTASQVLSEVMAEEPLQKLAALLEQEEHDTSQQSHRIARVAVVPGKRLGLHWEVLKLLARGGICHDFGKADEKVKEAVNTAENFDVTDCQTRDSIMARIVPRTSACITKHRNVLTFTSAD